MSFLTVLLHHLIFGTFILTGMNGSSLDAAVRGNTEEAYENSFKIGQNLENYVKFQDNSLCPYTISGTESLYLDVNVIFDQFPLFISPLKISSKISNIETTQLKLTREDSLKKSKKYEKNCQSFILFFAAVSEEVLQKLAAIGEPARDRFVLVFKDEAQLLTATSSPQFKALRLVYAFALEPQLHVFKLPNSPRSFVNYKENPVLIPKFSPDSNTLNGAHFRISALLIPPYLMQGPRGKFDYRGLSNTLYSTAANRYNFTFNYVLPASRKGGTGKRLPNGTWIGLLGEINEGRADIIISVSLAPDRLFGPFEFTDMYYPVSGAFVTALPKLTVHWMTLLKPLLPSTWAAVFAIQTFLSFIIYGLLTASNLSRRRQNMDHVPYKAFVWPFAALMEQSVGRIPSKIRWLISLWLMFGLVIGTGYKERLFSFMTFPAYDNIPQNMVQLAAMEEYSVLYSWWPNVQYFAWEKSNQSEYKKVFKRFQKEPSAFACVMKAAFQPKTVCVAYEFELLSGMAANLTYDGHFQPVYLTRERYFESHNTLPFKRGSVYADSWRKIASAFRDFGLPPRWLMNEIKRYRDDGVKWLKKQKDSLAWEEIQELKQRDSKVARALRFGDFLALLLLYVGGIAAGVMCFVLEMAIWNSCLNRLHGHLESEPTNCLNASQESFGTTKNNYFSFTPMNNKVRVVNSMQGTL